MHAVCKFKKIYTIFLSQQVANYLNIDQWTKCAIEVFQKVLGAELLPLSDF